MAQTTLTSVYRRRMHLTSQPLDLPFTFPHSQHDNTAIVLESERDVKPFHEGCGKVVRAVQDDGCDNPPGTVRQSGFVLKFRPDPRHTDGRYR